MSSGVGLSDSEMHAQHWRIRAAETCLLALRMKDAYAKAALLRAAKRYEQLAEPLERPAPAFLFSPRPDTIR
jgi:hypothetical protein